MKARRDWTAQNRRVVAEFRANGGAVGGYFADKPLLLLTTTGRRSGQARTAPLGYLAQSDGRLVVFGSVVGEPQDPDWYHNVIANPEVVVEVGPQRFAVVATILEGSERAALIAEHARLRPEWAVYLRQTSRPFPVIALDRE